MDYTKYKFKNKPSINEMIAYNNLFICGPTGAGKSTLLHQIIVDFLALEGYENFVLYVHDPSIVEFSRRKEYASLNFINARNELDFIQFLGNEINKRKSMTNIEMLDQKTLVIMSDNISYTKLGTFLLRVYKELKDIKILTILAAQQKVFYEENKSILNQGTVFLLQSTSEQKHHAIEIIR